jgi:hypothetical protein
MRLYCGIDLHSNNHVVVVIDEEDRRLVEKRLPLKYAPGGDARRERLRGA